MRGVTWASGMLVAGALCNCNCDPQNLDKAKCAYVVSPHDRRADDPAGADNRQLLFGEVQKGSSRTRTITVDNTASNVPLTGLRLAFSPVNSESYSLEGSVPDIAANQTVTLGIVFSPVPISGELGNTLTVSHADIEGSSCPTYTVTLLGRALPPNPPDAGIPDAAGLPDGSAPPDGGRRDGGHIYPRDDAGPGLTDTGHFEARGGLQVARTQAGAALLPNGKVLVAGGFDVHGQATAAVEIVDPWTGRSILGAPLHDPRARHSLTALADGRVLAIGGVDSGAATVVGMVPSVEIYDPVAGTWTRVTLVDPRADAAAVGLGDRVLVAYGEHNLPGQAFTPADGAYLVDSTGAVTPVTAVGAAGAGRTGAAAVEMGDGTVLFLGGLQAGTFTGEVVRFSATTMTVLGAALHTPRAQAAGARFSDGPVVVAGGVGAAGLLGDVESLDVSVELMAWQFQVLDTAVTPRAQAVGLRVADDVVLVAGGTDLLPGTGSLLARQDAELLVHVASVGVLAAGTVNDLSIPRVHASAVPYDGGVLVLGGSVTEPRRSARPDVERYLPGRNRFESAGLLGPGGAPAAAADHDVLVAGGVDLSTGRASTRTRVLNQDTGTFREGPALRVARTEASATLLQDGSILVAGGRSDHGEALDHAERVAAMLDGSQVQGRMRSARAGHTATALPDGRVLLCGGLGAGADPLDSCELYRPDSGSFSAVTGHMVRGRYGHSATLLEDGQVLLTGGNDPALGVFRGDLFNPADNTLTPTAGFPGVARRGHVALPVGTGQVLLAGGETNVGETVPTDTAELFDLTTGEYSALPPLASPREAPAGLLFAAGKVLVTGGSERVTNDPDFPSQALQRTELFDPAQGPSGTFRGVDQPLTTPRARAVGVDALGWPVVINGEGRHGTLASGVEARVPLTSVDVWVP